MTTEGAQLLKEAKADDRTVEETLADLQQRNTHLDWDVATMLPEVTNRHRDNHQIQAND